MSDNVEDDDADDCVRTLAPPTPGGCASATSVTTVTSAGVSSSTPCVPISSNNSGGSSNYNNNAGALWQSVPTSSEASTPGTPQMAISSLSSINAHTPTYRASSDTEKKRTRPGSVPLRKSLSQGGVPESEQVLQHPHSQMQQQQQQRSMHCISRDIIQLILIKLKILHD